METKSMEHPLSDRYDLGPILASGTYGTVRIITNYSTQTKYALKETVPNFAEIDIMSRYKHKNLIQLVEFCVAEAYDHQERYLSLYLVMEMGDLTLSGLVDFSDIGSIIKEMITSVNFLHKNGIVHGDVKLNNFVLKDKTVKIIDFSLSAFGDRPIYKCQSRTYEAPEILNRYHGKNFDFPTKYESVMATDIWALGVSIVDLFILQKYTDFSRDFDIMRYIENSVEYLSEIGVPEDWMSLVQLLLTIDPKQRLQNFNFVLKIYKIEYKAEPPTLTYFENTLPMSQTINLFNDAVDASLDIEVLFLALDIFRRVFVFYPEYMWIKVRMTCLYMAFDIANNYESDADCLKEYLKCKTKNFANLISLAGEIANLLNGKLYPENFYTGIHDVCMLIDRLALIEKYKPINIMLYKHSPRKLRIPVNLIYKMRD